jgi:hypothetical protein
VKPAHFLREIPEKPSYHGTILAQKRTSRLSREAVFAGTFSGTRTGR